MTSSTSDAERLRRELSAVQGVLALSMLMMDVEDEHRIWQLTTGAVATIPGGRLLRVLAADGSLVFTPDDVARDGDAAEGGVGARGGVAVPMRTHRHRFGSLVVNEEAVCGFGAFLVQAVSHEAAVALAACRQRTTLRQQAEEIAASEARFRDIAERSPDIVWHVTSGPPARLDYLSPSFTRITGIPLEAIGDDVRAFMEIIGPATGSRPALLAEDGRIADPWTCDRFFSSVQRPDGSQVTLETSVAVVPDGLQGIARDMTEVRRLQAELVEQAMRDPLTGAANRRLLDELLAVTLERARRTGGTVAVAFLDLDEFKGVNDSLGHAAGDRVLAETSRRLRASIRSGDIVARVGGDEFVLVFDPAGTSPEALVTRIRAALSLPITTGPGRSVLCSASIGIADTSCVGDDPERLIRAADTAMYADKQRRAHRRASSWPAPGASGPSRDRLSA